MIYELMKNIIGTDWYLSQWCLAIFAIFILFHFLGIISGEIWKLIYCYVNETRKKPKNWYYNFFYKIFASEIDYERYLIDDDMYLNSDFPQLFTAIFFPFVVALLFLVVDFYPLFIISILIIYAVLRLARYVVRINKKIEKIKTI